MLKSFAPCADPQASHPAEVIPASRPGKRGLMVRTLPAAALAALDEERRPLYESVAALVVDVDTLTPEQVADRVVDGLGLSRVVS